MFVCFRSFVSRDAEWVDGAGRIRRMGRTILLGGFCPWSGGEGEVVSTGCGKVGVRGKLTGDFGLG